MAEFNIDDYFARRSGASAFAPNTGVDKTQALQNATALKVEALGEYRRNLEEQARRNAEADRNSLVGKLDLNEDGLVAKAVNFGAYALDGAARLPLNVGATIHDLRTAAIEQDIPDEAKLAEGRYREGKATPEDMVLLNLPAGRTAAPDPRTETKIQRDRRANAETNLQRIDRMRSAMSDGAAVREVLEASSNMVHRGDEREMIRQARDGFQENITGVEQGWESLKEGEIAQAAGEIVPGIAGLLANIGSVARDNPAAATGLIANNIPQLALAAAGWGGMAMATVPYAVNEFGKGIADYAKKHNGALPPEEEMHRMAGWAASLAVAEAAGEKLTLGFGKILGKSGKVLAEGAEEVAETATREGFKAALSKATGAVAKSSLGRVTGAGLRGGAGEFATEAYQTYGENNIVNEATTLEDAYVGGTLGAVAGGGLGAGVQLAREVTGTTEEAVAAATRIQADRQATQEAIKAGDPSVFLDPKSAKYDPAKAIDVISAQAVAPGATPETKQEALTQATEVVSNLEIQRARMAVQVQASTEQGLQGMIQATDKMIVEADPTDTEYVGALQERRSLIEEELAALRADTGTAQKKAQARQQALEKIEQDLSRAQGRLDNLASTVNALPATEEIEATIEAVNAPVTAGDTQAAAQSQQAASKLITLAMASPEVLSAEQASALAENTDNAFTPAQRAYLRELSAAQVEANMLKTMGEVSQAIYYGQGKDVGIAQYRQRMATAVQANNQKAAQKQLQDLTAFAKSHEAKAALAAKVGLGGQIVRTKDGRWVTPDTRMSRDQLRKNAGLELNSPTLIADIAQESKALLAASKELKSAYELKFGKPVQKTPAAAPTVDTANSSTQAPLGAAANKSREQSTPVVSNPTPSSTESAPASAASSQSAGTAPAVPVSTGSGITAQRSVPEGILAELSALREGTPLRNATPVEAAFMDEIFNEIQSMLQTDFMYLVDGIVVIDQVGTNGGWAKEYNGKYYLALKATAMSMEAHPKTGESARQYSARVLAHELAHILDMRLTHEGQQIHQKGVFQPGGKFREEAATFFNETLDPFWKSFFRYPLETVKDPVEQSKELYAQLFSMYLYYPEQMSEHLKTTFAGFQRVYRPQSTGSATAEGSGTARQPEQGALPAGGRTGDGTGTPANATQEVAPAYDPDEDTGAYTGLRLYKQKLTELAGSMQEVFGSLNLVAQFTKQQAETDRSIAPRPLVKVRNFLSAWRGGHIAPEEFLGMEGSQTLTEREEGALDHFKQTMALWLPEFAKNFERDTKVREDFRQQDMMQFLLEQMPDGTVDVEENIKTAMGYAGYHWLLQQTYSPRLLTNDQVMDMHGLDGDTEVDPSGMSTLRRFNAFEETAINELGRIAIDALGLRNTSDAPQDILPRLQTAMGIHTLALLERGAYIKRQSIPAADVMRWLKGEKANPALAQQFRGYEKFSYVALNRDTKGELSDRLRDLKAANLESRGVVDALFGLEDAPRFARTKPADFKQKTAKKTNQELPRLLSDVLQETMQVPHRVIPDMYLLTQVLGRGNILTIAGAKDLESGKFQSTERESIAAQNDNLANQYDLMEELLNQADNEVGVDTEFFVDAEGWRNFRAGFLNQSMNLQTSKIHRAMFARPSWTETIHLGNPEEEAALMVAVAQAMGVKTDKKNYADAIAEFAQKLDNDAELKRAIALLRQGIVDEDMTVWTDENKALVTKVAQAEGMMSLQAMVAFARYEHARINGLPSVDVTMLVGADGKTSGPMLSHFALGAATDAEALMKTLNRGGFYSNKEGEPVNFNEWVEKNNGKDLYEDLSAQILTFAQKFIIPAGQSLQQIAKEKGKQAYYAYFSREEWQALQVLTGNLMNDLQEVTSAGRNLVKTPLTAFAFGSALQKSIQNMEDKFIAGIYEQFTKLAQGKAKSSRKEVLAAINVLIKKGDYQAELLNDLDIDQLLEGHFKPTSEKALRAAFQTILGKPTKHTMEGYFAVFMQRRQALNQSLQAGFMAYQAAYSAARDREIERLMDEGKIAYRESTNKVGVTTRVPKHDMTKAQETALRKRFEALLPVVHTVYSQRENNLRAGIYMAKTEKDKSASPLYASKVHLKNKLVNARDEFANYLTAFGEVRAEISPGVAGTPYMIHSLDSANIHMAIAQVKEAMNVHDEIGTGPLRIKQAAYEINKATAQNLLDYSPTREAANLFERMVLGLAAKIAKKELPPSVAVATFRQWAELVEKGSASKADRVRNAGLAMSELTLQNAYEADTLRLGVLAQMGSVDQYPWQGGEFIVPEEMRAEAQRRLSKIPSALSPKAQQALDYLSQIVEQNLTGSAQASASAQAAAELFAQESEAAPTLESSANIGLPGVKAALVVEAVAEQIPAVANAMAQGQSVEAAVNALPTQERAKAIGQLAQSAALVPDSRVSPWGVLGHSAITHDAELVTTFEANPVMNREQVVSMLREHLKALGNNQFNLLLLDRLASVLPANLEVRYLTSATLPDGRMSVREDKARGWFVTDPDTNERVVNILSAEHLHAGVTPEVVLHELVHAALVEAIDDPSGEAKLLVQELTDLLAAAKQYVEAHPALPTEYAQAVSSVQELVAWGMTSKGFQDAVLRNIEFEASVAGRTKLVQGAKQFIRSIVNFLFAPWSYAKKEVAENALGVLVFNVAGLFEQAAKSPASVASRQTLKQGSPDPIDSARAMDSMALYEALQDANTPLGADFDTHLRSVLADMVARIHGPAGTFKEVFQDNIGLSATDMLQRALDTGVAPFASKVLGSGFAVNRQEAFVLEQIEATVQAALDMSENQTSAVYKELSKLYDEAAKRLTEKDFLEGDWATAHQWQRDQAQALYDFVFKIEAGADDRSDYLSRFAALGLAHEQFNRKLRFDTTVRTSDLGSNPTLAARLLDVFERIMQFINGKLTHTFEGQRADAKLTMLARQLVEIEAKRQAVTAKDRFSVLNAIEQSTKGLAEGARNKVSQLAQADLFRNNRFQVVRGLSGTARILAEDRVEAVMDHITKIRNKYEKDKEGMLSGLVSYVRGAKPAFQTLLRAAKLVERERKFLINQTGKFVLASFAQGSLSKAQREAVGEVFLHTDMEMLLDRLGIGGIHALLDSRQALHNEIQSLENQLAQFGNLQHYYKNQAHLLGYHLATGIARGAHVMLNAGNIAKLHGTPHQGRVSEAQAATATKLIDELASLRALQYTSAQSKQAAKAVLEAEMARQDGGNGVETVMKLHAKLQQESRETLFQGNEALMIKGYTPDISNPHTAVRVADAASGADLQAQGWVKTADLMQDPADPVKSDKALYVMRDGGLSPHTTGSLSFTGQRARGTRQHNGFTSPWTAEGLDNLQLQATMENAKQRAIADLFKPNPGFSPDKVRDTFAVPVLNHAGKVTNYRYMMASSTKKALLERDTRFDKMLGAMAGNVFDKVSTAQQNRRVIEAMKTLYDEERLTNADAYVKVSHDSSDLELRELYAILPEVTREDIRQIWGRHGVMVRKDLLNITFGYRKMSLGDIFDKDDTQRNKAEHALVRGVEILLTNYAIGDNMRRQAQGKPLHDTSKYARRAAMVVRRNERIWQEVVHELKDIIVIKSGGVLLGNILANVSLLAMNGVNVPDMIRHHRVAIRGALDYQRDKAALFALENQLAMGQVGNAAQLQQEILKLKNAIARNPVKQLIDEGLMPTIVEDVEVDDDLYSYKSAFTRKVDKAMGKLHPGVRTVLRGAYLTHDTKLYKGLSLTTQLSDFVARYTLYQHLVNKKQGALTHEQAVQEASDAFINYDIPMPKGMQYLDDMGITMFSKYFLGIQRVLMKLAREHPARVLSLVLMNNLFDLMPMVTDSAAVSRVGNNPLNWGAFQYPGVLDELLTVDVGLKLVK